MFGSSEYTGLQLVSYKFIYTVLNKMSIIRHMVVKMKNSLAKFRENYVKRVKIVKLN